MENSKKLKIVIVGPPASGKTCFLERLLGKKFNSESISTIGVNFGIVEVGGNIQLNVWDAAGSDHYQKIIEYYLRGIDAAIVMLACDTLDWDAKDYIRNIVSTIRSKKNDGLKKMKGIPDFTVPILLVCSKTDTCKDESGGSMETFCESMVKELNLHSYVLTSSKTMSRHTLLEKLYPFAKHICIKNVSATSALTSKTTQLAMANKCCTIS